jgi:putative lumazine-binding protein
MKRFAIAFCFLLLNITTNAQQRKSPVDDSAAVRTTVTNYIEAYYTGDARRMEQTLHPHYLKHMIHGDIPVREKTGSEMVREVRTHGPADLPQSNKTEEVTVLDVAGSIASAKLVTPGWVDYMTLEKVNAEWKILAVVQRIND